MATTYVSTIKSSLGDYTSLSACEAGRQAAHASGDISAATGDDSIEEWVCYALTDTTAVVIDGWTTAAGNYIYVHADSTARHAGVWSASKYNLSVTDAIVLTISDHYFYIDGLQISTVSPTGAGKHGIVQDISILDSRISNCIVKGHNHASYTQEGMKLSGNAYVWNSIIYNFKAIDNNIVIRAAGTVNIYSCTGIGGELGIYKTGACVAKNCYFGGSKSGDYYGSPTMTTCASLDHTGSDEALHAIAIGTDTFVNVSSGTEDFHLAADGLSPLQGVGTDTSGDAAPLNFTTDIDGDTRDATWDIGADAWVVAGGAVWIPKVIFIG